MKLLNQVRYALMRKVQNKKLRDLIVSYSAVRKGNIAVFPGKSVFADSANLANVAISSLKEEGCYEFDQKISEKTINSIIEKIKPLKCSDPYNKINGLDLDNIPAETHVANYDLTDLVQIAEIMQLANDPLLLKVAQDFIGCKPTISSVNLWWSIPGKEKAKDSQNFHRDVDDFKFLKFFIGLTDVTTMNDGPHVYVKNSSNSNKLRRLGRFTDEEVENSFGKENIVYFTRPKGTCFFVDTYGIHKGLLPNANKRRLLLQFEYSINPIYAYDYKKVTVNNNDFDKYVNRLFFEN